MIEKFTPTEEIIEKPSESQLTTMIGLAAAEVEYLSQEKHRTHYFIHPEAEDKKSQQTWIEMVDKLKSLYPSMVFISLRIDGDLKIEEFKKYRPLYDIL